MVWKSLTHILQNVYKLETTKNETTKRKKNNREKWATYLKVYLYNAFETESTYVADRTHR